LARVCLSKLGKNDWIDRMQLARVCLSNLGKNDWIDRPVTPASSATSRRAAN
jgi:hypothetical protein